MLNRQTLKEGALAVLSGLFLLSAFPSIEYDWLAWIFLVPLLVALSNQKALPSFYLPFLGGLVFFGGIFGPVAAGTVDSLKPIHFLLSALYFSVFWGLWGSAYTWICRTTAFPSALIAAVLWVTLEFARAHAGFLSYPGLLLGHTMYQHSSLIQLSSLTGVYGLSFLILVVNAGIVDCLLMLRQHAWMKAALCILPATALVVATLALGNRILSSEQPTSHFPVALVQGNILSQNKWVPFAQQRILNEYSRLSRQAAAGSPKLIVWPESAIPGDIQHQGQLREQVGRIAMASHAYLLIGSSEYAKFNGPDRSSREYYNSMVLVSPSGDIGGVYRKQKLVPFAEYVPLEEWVSWPRFIGSVLGGAVAGRGWQIFNVENVRVATVICWETLFPEIVRGFVQRGAQVMVAATDESWFGKTSEPHQLLAITVFRAAENRVAIARSANTGLSALIDPFGRIISMVNGPAQDDLFVQGTLNGSLPVSHGHTFYTQYGDVFAVFLIILTVFCVLYAGVLHRHRSVALVRVPGSCVRTGEGG